MKRLVFIILISLAVSSILLAQPTGNDATKEPRWGFSGSIEMGGLRLSGEGFDLVRDEGYGTVGTESIIALFSAGVDYRRPEVFDLSLTFSYLAGGSFVWQNLFGDIGSEFSLFGDSLGIQVEIQPLFPWLQGFHPFIGGGWSLTNGLVDEIGEGFVRGSGPFVVGGLCIYNALGLYPYLPFSLDDESFFGLRISLYYRFPYAYSFRLDWDEFEENYFGPVDADTLQTFFEGHEFPSSSFAFSVGISMGYAPFPVSGK